MSKENTVEYRNELRPSNEEIKNLMDYLMSAGRWDEANVVARLADVGVASEAAFTALKESQRRLISEGQKYRILVQTEAQSICNWYEKHPEKIEGWGKRIIELSHDHCRYLAGTHWKPITDEPEGKE